MYQTNLHTSKQFDKHIQFDKYFDHLQGFLKKPSNKPSMTSVLTYYVSEFRENIFSSDESVFFASNIKFEYLQIENT